MRLIFVRHGEPDYQNDRLTDNGKDQARCTATRLEKEDIKAIYSSPMGRAKETASYTAQNHGLDIQVLDFMHEIDWGDRDANVTEEAKIPYDGHPWTLAYRYLSDEAKGSDHLYWADHHFFKDNRCFDYYEKISEDFDKFLEGYGLIRTGNLYECLKENDDTIALFAHGGSGAVMFSHILNLPFPFVLTSMPYGVCSVSIIDFSAKNGEIVIPRLELFNDMEHIETFLAEKLHFEK